jgi:Holliday junction resolvase
MVNSRNKGARGEREFALLCRGEGYDVRRGQQFSGLEGEDVVGLPNIHVEVKRVEKLNIYNAIEQSVRDATEGNVPIVAHRKDRCDWLITLKADDFFRLYRESGWPDVKR